MASQPNPSPKVVFGPFEYDDTSGDLRKYGAPIRLQGKPLQILRLLVNRSGQIITRDELQRHLWEGTTFVDFEHGLNSAVNKLRQTLGDCADQPRYVETLWGGHNLATKLGKDAPPERDLQQPRRKPADVHAGERAPGRENDGQE